MARYFMNHEPLTFEDFDVLVTELTGELVEESPRLDSLTCQLEQALERIADSENELAADVRALQARVADLEEVGL